MFKRMTISTFVLAVLLMLLANTAKTYSQFCDLPEPSTENYYIANMIDYPDVTYQPYERWHQDSPTQYELFFKAFDFTSTVDYPFLGNMCGAIKAALAHALTRDFPFLPPPGSCYTVIVRIPTCMQVRYSTYVDGGGVLHYRTFVSYCERQPQPWPCCKATYMICRRLDGSISTWRMDLTNSGGACVAGCSDICSDACIPRNSEYNPMMGSIVYFRPTIDNEENNLSSITVSPNPTEGNATISLFSTVNGTVKLSIYNAAGVCMETQTAEKSESSTTFSFNGDLYPTGVYFFRATINESVIQSGSFVISK